MVEGPPPLIVSEWKPLVISRSPVAAPFSCVALASVKLYVVAGCRLMIIGVTLMSALALMIAPRKLQSFAAAVHADAPATSSVRSTFKLVAKYGFTSAAACLRAATREEVRELENAVCVNLSEAPAKN